MQSLDQYLCHKGRSKNAVVYEAIHKDCLVPVLLLESKGDTSVIFTQFPSDNNFPVWYKSPIRNTSDYLIVTSEKPVIHKVYQEEEVKFLLDFYEETELDILFLQKLAQGYKRCSFVLDKWTILKVIDSIQAKLETKYLYNSCISHSGQVNKLEAENALFVISLYSLDTIIVNFKNVPLDGLGISIELIHKESTVTYKELCIYYSAYMLFSRTVENVFNVDCVKKFYFNKIPYAQIKKCLANSDVFNKNPEEILKGKLGRLAVKQQSTAECLEDIKAPIADNGLSDKKNRLVASSASYKYVSAVSDKSTRSKVKYDTYLNISPRDIEVLKSEANMLYQDMPAILEEIVPIPVEAVSMPLDDVVMNTENNNTSKSGFKYGDPNTKYGDFSVEYFADPVETLTTAPKDVYTEDPVDKALNKLLKEQLVKKNLVHDEYKAFLSAVKPVKSKTVFSSDAIKYATAPVIESKTTAATTIIASHYVDATESLNQNTDSSSSGSLHKKKKRL